MKSSSSLWKRIKQWKQGSLICGFLAMAMAWNAMNLGVGGSIFAGDDGISDYGPSEDMQQGDEQTDRARDDRSNEKTSSSGAEKEDERKELEKKEEGTSAEAESMEETQTKPVTEAKTKEEVDAKEEAETEAVERLPEHAVSADYFDDALFIGDSRVAGLAQYVPELDQKATFYAKQSLTIFKMLGAKIVETDDGTITVDEGLQNQTFGKIYLMVGLNEIDVGNVGYFQRHYREVLSRILELQPDADIYLQGIMHVTEHKSNADLIYNNKNINDRNQAIKALADEDRFDKVYYIDVNESTDDETGNLRPELTADEVHLKASAYALWYEYLKEHGV